MRSQLSRTRIHQSVIIAVATVLSASFMVPVLRADEDDDDGSGRIDMSAVEPDAREERVQMRNVGEGFKLRRSQHYSIIYDTSEEDVAVFQAAIEKTYRWCMRYCKSMNIPTHKPQKKLLTHFFDDFPDYSLYSARIGLGGKSPGTLGFYHPITNYTYFYNYANRPDYKAARENARFQIERLGEQLRRGDLSPEAKKGIRNQIKQLRRVINGTTSEGSETTEAVLQHEVAHQVLFNIGFHNERAALKGANPRWFAEGMASLFEPRSDGSAGGFGLINKERAEQYHHLVRVGGLIPLDSFVSDIRWFFQADTGGRAYPQAWALAHYLTRTKRDELTAYIADLNKRDLTFEGSFDKPNEKDLELFEKHFGKPDEAFTERWKDYMEGIH